MPSLFFWSLDKLANDPMSASSGNCTIWWSKETTDCDLLSAPHSVTPSWKESHSLLLLPSPEKKKFIYFRKFRLGFICLLRVHVGFWSDGLSPAGEQTKQPGPSQQVVRIQGTQTITLASLPEVFPSKRLRGFTTQEGDLCCKPAESHHQEGKGGPHWFGVMQAKKQSKIRSQLCSITLSSSVSCVHTTGWGQQASWGIETSIALDISQTRFISHGLGSHSELFAGPLGKYYRQTQELKL